MILAKKPKTVQDLFNGEREAWLISARAAAVKLLKRHQLITIEDVLEKCPRPQYVHPNTTGHVFQSEEFVAVGWRASRRASMNGRQVRVWSLKDA